MRRPLPLVCLLIIVNHPKAQANGLLRNVEVRFKNNGLEAIEVQDNGVGISRENYETIGTSTSITTVIFDWQYWIGVALKHYTSKLSSYDDLTSLTTFGFRGEALSSLCALSSFHVITARADEVPKGTMLDFEISGRLKGTQVVASQRGTTVVVEKLFMNLPVRRRELEKNVKREYGKVVGLLQAYACISTNTKFVVSNMMAKGKKAIVFATKGNPTTRENIANVYGAKALSGLVALDLSFEMKRTKLMQSGTEWVVPLGQLFFLFITLILTDSQVTSTYMSWVMSQDRFLVKADRRLIVKCSLSTGGRVHSPKSPKSSMRSTNPIICPSRHSYFRTFCWILVRTRPRTAGH